MLNAGELQSPPKIASVLGRYEEVAAARSVAVARLPGGAASASWLVEADGKQFVLHRLPGTGHAHASFATGVHERAARAGLAPPLLANDAGGLLTAYGGCYFQLMQRAEGELYPDSFPGVPLCEELGRALGRLHHVLASLTPRPAVPRLEFPVDHAEPLRAAHAAHQHRTCPHAGARRVLAVKLGRAEALSRKLLDDLGSLPQQAIHGDVHPGNILVRRSGADGHPLIAAFIDFDLARFAPAGYEVMRALLYCVKPAGPLSAFAPRATAFLNGYLDSHQLSGEEIDAMASLYETVQVLDPYGLDRCHDAHQPLLRFGHARFALLYWLRRHGPHIASLARRRPHNADGATGSAAINDG